MACSKDGSIVDGNVISGNKYVCDAGSFRIANETDVSLNLGCVSYTENDKIRKRVSEGQDSVYTCKSVWVGSVEFYAEYGTLLDTRDKHTYKIVTIGTQKWMAENLNYADSINYPGMKGRNRCYNNRLDSCTKYGRLYTWAAAMDSAGAFSTNGKNCGYNKICSPTYPVRGICPEGWHLPSKTEYETLFTAVGGELTASKVLKSTTGWKSNRNGTDAYGFSALPAGEGTYDGDFCFVGSEAVFWSASEEIEYGRDNAFSRLAYTMGVGYEFDTGVIGTEAKFWLLSVRCVKD